jgi:hypothetical protein
MEYPFRQHVDFFAPDSTNGAPPDELVAAVGLKLWRLIQSFSPNENEILGPITVQGRPNQSLECSDRNIQTVLASWRLK